MTLSGAQYEQIQEALLAAFNEADLRRMVRIQLDADLDAVSGGKNLSERVYSLIEWADREGRVLALIDGATAQNSGNAKLQALKVVATDWHPEPAEAGEPPYQGLQYFDVKDADRFFGREKLTAELVGYLHNHRVLSVIGASGSGKSSVVRAGMVPALQSGKPLADDSLPPKGSERWLVHILTPTAHPLESLATQLVPKGARLTVITDLMDDLASDDRCLHLYNLQLLAGDKEHDRLLLVVDQFEELFTLCKDKDEQRAFVSNLLTAASPDGGTIVILTLRADFYAHCSDFANLRAALETNQRYIGAMSPDELRTAIESPAEQDKWSLEPGLVDKMLDDMAGEPGALPLLSHALLETWKRRSGRMLTFAGYHAAGYVKGAIARTADSVYAELSLEEQAIARNIFLRLTELGEGVQDTRRRVQLAELIPRNEAAPIVEYVLKRLQDERLVRAEREQSTGEDAALTVEPPIYVDVTHEALIREWPVLRDWLAEDREGLRTHRKLTDSVMEWERLNRDTSILYRGLQLDQTMAWAAVHRADLNEKETAFLDESQATVDAERLRLERLERERKEALQRELKQAQAVATSAEAQRKAETALKEEAVARAIGEAKARNRTRWLLIGAIVFLVVLAVGITYFIYQNQQLGIEKQNALDARAKAISAEATAQANFDLASKQLQELEGARLLREATAARVARDAPTAISKFRAALAADPSLDIDVSKEVSDTWRYIAMQLIYEGELSASQNNYDAAARKFEEALAVDPPSDTPVYVWVPDGEFMMGSSDDDKQALEDEKPQQVVYLDGYWVMRTEVTNEQYKRCADAGVCPKLENQRWNREEYSREPVTDVKWAWAMTYAEWVGGRLPTEAEWEKACRGTNGFKTPWGNENPTEKQLNFVRSGLNAVGTVGSYPPGVYGLYDMLGNVREWTLDYYSPDSYSITPLRNPTGPADGDARTFRGGSWSDNIGIMRCAARNWLFPGFKNYDLGFRVVIDGSKNDRSD